MAGISYHDLAEFGLPLFPPDDPSFPDLVRDIQYGPPAFGSWNMSETNEAAVLLNRSGNAIVVLSYIWRHKLVGGTAHTSHVSNLGSSTQMDFLSGRSGIVRDLGSFILPGSKRLLTENGMFGANLDVLPAQSAGYGGGMGSRGGRGFRRTGEQIVHTELILDAAIFEDGLCAGPDEFGLFEVLTEELHWQQHTATQMVAALRDGATASQVFDMLRAPAPAAGPGAGRRQRPIRDVFKRLALDHMMNIAGSGLLAWFERIAQSSPIRLHRPS